MNRSTLLISLTMVLAFVPASWAVMSWAQPLEGTKWKVKVVPEEDAVKAGIEPFDDLLTFKGGKFNTDSSKKRGIAAADFEEDSRRGPIATFSAELKDSKGGKSKWTGTVTGSEISGQMEWSSKEGGTITYTFKGEKVQQ